MEVATAGSDIDLETWHANALNFENEIAKAIIGQSRVIRMINIAMFARGHVLLEGDVGVGKTMLLRSVARAIGGPYSRVEGTIDLMPADLIYHTYLSEEGRPRVDAGPILQHGSELSVFFFNEINRARPQVHALLLRLMAEGTVSAFNEEIEFPFLQVFADRNQVEREETFELPAAARDRFFMEISVETPQDSDIRRNLIFDPQYHDTEGLLSKVTEQVLDYRQLEAVSRAIQYAVQVSPALEQYVLDLWEALRYPERVGLQLDDVEMDRLVIGGASPRGMAVLVRAARIHAWLEGRDILIPEDIREVFTETVAHRVFLSPMYEVHREQFMGELVEAVFSHVAVP